MMHGQNNVKLRCTVKTTLSYDARSKEHYVMMHGQNNIKL
jgi:hypothetical protein